MLTPAQSWAIRRRIDTRAIDYTMVAFNGTDMRDLIYSPHTVIRKTLGAALPAMVSFDVRTQIKREIKISAK